MSTNSFLIIGAQRSGTSLLTRILNQHPQLAVPPESHFFNTFVPLQRFYGDLNEEHNLNKLIDDVLTTPKISEWSSLPTPGQILARLHERNLGAVFVALLDSWAESQGKSIWGEKSPRHVFYWSEISESLPNIPAVHIVRDGRDVALGLIRARFGPKSVYAAGKRWKRWMAAIEEKFSVALRHVEYFQDASVHIVSPKPVANLVQQLLMQKGFQQQQIHHEIIRGNPDLKCIGPTV